MRKLFVTGISFIFLSCLSIDSKMTLAANGSGSLELVYTVSSFARDWDASGSGNSPLPLPVNEGDFRRSVNMIQGISLTSYSRREENDSTVIRAVLGFTSVEALNRFVAGPQSVFALRQEGTRTIFEQTITEGTKSSLGEDYLEFVRTFFSPYVLSFTLTAPRAVTRAIPSQNVLGQTASVSFPLAHVMESSQPVIWQVEW